MRRDIFEIIALGLFVTFLHQRALAAYWYWLFPLTDVLMHFLGGLLIGLIVLLLLKRFSTVDFTKKQVVLFVLGGTLVVGIAWEIFEYFAGVFLAEEFFPDMLYDLVMGVVGALAALFARRVL